MASGHADRFGSKIFRDVAPGPGLRVRRASGSRSAAFRVLRRDENPRCA